MTHRDIRNLALLSKQPALSSEEKRAVAAFFDKVSRCITTEAEENE